MLHITPQNQNYHAVNTSKSDISASFFYAWPDVVWPCGILQIFGVEHPKGANTPFTPGGQDAGNATLHILPPKRFIR